MKDITIKQDLFNKLNSIKLNKPYWYMWTEGIDKLFSSN